jgi:hypothetical protein
LQDRTRFRCSSISSRIVNLPSALGIQARFENRPDDFILSYFYEMESPPRERVDGLLQPRETIASAHAEDYGSSGEFFSSGVGEIESFT